MLLLLMVMMLMMMMIMHMLSSSLASLVILSSLLPLLPCYLMLSHAREDIIERRDGLRHIRPLVQHHAVGTLRHGGVCDFSARGNADFRQRLEHLRRPDHRYVRGLSSFSFARVSRRLARRRRKKRLMWEQYVASCGGEI